MLNLTSPTAQHCNVLSRRQLLTIGSLGVAGLRLPELLRAEDAAGIKSSRKQTDALDLDKEDPKALARYTPRVDRDAYPGLFITPRNTTSDRGALTYSVGWVVMVDKAPFPPVADVAVEVVPAGLCGGHPVSATGRGCGVRASQTWR